jgi:multidrug efflux system membrane fusion protein
MSALGSTYLAATALLSCALAGCSAGPAQAKEALRDSATLVHLAPVERGPVKRTLHTMGRVQVQSHLDLAFKIGGVVASVKVDAGEQVSKGQILASLDLTEARAERARAQHVMVRATRDRDRARELFALHSISLMDLQNAETGVALATSSEAAAVFNLQHAVIVAPDDGVVDRRDLEVGEIVTPGQPVLHMIGSSRGMVVRTAVPEREVLLLRAGDPATVKLEVLPDTPLSATVTSISSVATPGTGTFDVELALAANHDQPLVSGLSASVTIEHVEHPQATVPLSALVDGAGEHAAVFVVEGNTARRAPVKVMFFAGERAALSRGLESGAAVVDRGAEQLLDGATVRVAP